MDYVILKAQVVQVKPFQRKGKLVIGYSRVDPRTRHGVEKVARSFADSLEDLTRDRLDLQTVEVEDYGDKWHMEFFMWEHAADQVPMTRYNEKTAGLMGRFEVNYYKDGENAYISALFLKDEYQSSGLGTDMIKRFIDHGVQNGFRTFKMLANGDVGAYAWPMQGFDFAKTQDKSDTQNHFVKWLEKKHKYIALPKYFPHAWDIASFKIDDEKVGKDYLLHEGRTFFEAKLEVRTEGWEIHKKYYELRKKKNA
jgi:GNAT superfamily N-acetyltransferase